MRPENPIGLNLTRRPTAPVKLPRITFPIGGDNAESSETPAAVTPEAMHFPIPEPDESPAPQDCTQPEAPAPQPAPACSSASGQVIVYGRGKCAASLAAVQDLINRQVSFSYIDVDRNPEAMAHLVVVCGNSQPVVPVIISIGFGGT